jgi:hypothetical protein
VVEVLAIDEADDPLGRLYHDQTDRKRITPSEAVAGWSDGE